MLKFLDRDKALSTINQWILDGSRLESWGNNEDSEWVVLRGRDGAREEIYIAYTQESYDAMRDW